MSLQVAGLSVDIGSRRIVDDVDISVPDGHFVGLLGPNGSGKSTILKAIYRVRTPASGRVLLDGSDLLAMPPKVAARRVAVVAQETTVEFDFTVFEMVMIGRTPHKKAFERDDDADRAAAIQAIERVGCGHLISRSFNTLSGGEKQRALIARALTQGADHLILDEPTNHLDIRYQIEVLELVAGLNVTVLAALHDLSLAALFCDTVYLLTDGHIIADGPPRTVITAETVRHAYGADVLIVDHPETGTPHLIPRRSADGSEDPPPRRADPLHRPERMIVASHPRPRSYRRGNLRAAALVGTLVAVSAMLAACSSSSSAPSAAASPSSASSGSASSGSASSGSASSGSATAAAAAYPVTISDCGTPVTFTSAPTRAVSNDINTTEDMIALGLQAHMAGEFAASGSLPAGKPFPAQFAAGFKQIHEVSPDYFTLEQLVALHPDFLFAGWNYGLQVGTNLTPTNLATYGIKTLALTESCAHVQTSKQSVSIDDTYTDLTDLGEIFNVRPKAAQVIDSMKAQIAAVQAKVASLPKVTVFDYDSGTAAPFTGPGLAMPNAEITLGGGTNIFASLEQSWTSVSWEQVVKADPGCIIINDYSTPSAAAKEKFLETSPITKNLTAVRNRCFLALSYDEVTPSPRNAEAIVAIARWLHPTAFGLPADGS